VSGLLPVEYGYTPHGLLSHIRHGGRAWRLEYDTSGRLETVRDTLARLTRFGYDGADRVTSMTVARAARGWRRPSDHVPVTVTLEA